MIESKILSKLLKLAAPSAKTCKHKLLKTYNIKTHEPMLLAKHHAMRSNGLHE